MKERDVLAQTTAMLDAFGWRWWHVPAPMVAGKGEWRPYKKAAGLPDIFAFHDDPPRMVILELKGSKGKLSDDQREFLRLARGVAETWEQAWPHTAATRPLGVYVVEPGNIDALETMLRTGVLT
jgi:hypothetical protein